MTSNTGATIDHMHLTAAGNARVAAGFVQPILEMATWRAIGQPEK